MSKETAMMSALFVGDAAARVVLGLSPWILPVIAVAAKLTYDHARSALRGECAPSRPDGKGNAGREGRPDQENLPDCITAKLAGK